MVGSQLYIAKDAPLYRPGLIASAVCFGLTFIVILIMRFYYILVNRSRDRKAAQSGLEQLAQGKLNGANDMTDMRMSTLLCYGEELTDNQRTRTSGTHTKSLTSFGCPDSSIYISRSSAYHFVVLIS